MDRQGRWMEGRKLYGVVSRQGAEDRLGGRADEVSGLRSRRCGRGWVEGQMPREVGGVVDGGVEGGCMGGGTRWKKMGRLGGGITGWMAPGWRAEDTAGRCSCKHGAWLGAEAGWAGWTGDGVRAEEVGRSTDPGPHQ